ncbi:MAG: S-adenosylmethionine decarboxylase [Bacteroidia bacterium]|nr:S-adenosylmethionine decarboxylase [Bacteroidia bacterium]
MPKNKKIKYKFEPQGKTINTTLSESHATVHTYPEHGYIYTELMTCGDIDTKEFITGMLEHFQPVFGTLRILDRSYE